MQNFYKETSKSRAELENQSLDSSATSDAIALVAAVQDLKKRFGFYEKRVEEFKSGERLLTIARHPLPNSWIFAEHVAGEWDVLSELVRRKDAAIKAEVENNQF